jgi:hypothetical protein
MEDEHGGGRYRRRQILIVNLTEEVDDRCGEET